ncbi:hypothetical protein BD626DRAFT_547418 [Schizophyllum amplum]|uniref:NAD(P)-binding protein n=1 Tax=Schizophyllum amplum TaxID=97359 RepID=A0A550CHQ8_9AGAR|nr:hypothetical protein BD626DRAFT_547418 [Auriculariopsis ampla]
MPALTTARSFNASQDSSSYLPVAVFIGGTAGIGRAMAEAFVRHTNGRVRVIIVGRNATAAAEMIAALPLAARERAEFVKCDMSLMRNIDVALSELAGRGITKINYLIVSSGLLPANGRQETDEGLDRTIAVVYYGRWKFIHGLQDALSAAVAAGEPAKVMSVLAAGEGGPIDLDDLGVKKNYSLMNVTRTDATYNDLMLEKFAQLHSEVSFVHAYPGVVHTNVAVNSQSWLLTMIYYLLYPVVMLVARSPEDCAELMWYAVHHSGKGLARVNGKGDDIGMKNWYGTEESVERLWEHTLDATKSRGAA